ncbi:hypothetical protein DRE_06578 [Drechslerella stenobrocha 248]|uniref:F-box domain-containing protein n=1 Tax=Drechslerella stenobrocha 248 TaxID=1043628 RepID=W7HX50_9PEZI|nr:hypothetical protein DRE_06578 [Drechslerella stenobrocha 248]
MAQVYGEIRVAPQRPNRNAMMPEPRAFIDYERELQASTYDLDGRSASDYDEDRLGSGSEYSDDDDDDDDDWHRGEDHNGNNDGGNHNDEDEEEEEEQQRESEADEQSHDQGQEQDRDPEPEDQQDDEDEDEDPKEDDEPGPKLVGQEKWMFEHEKRMLQQEQRMLAHHQRMLAQDQRAFAHESKMIKQERWINDQRQKLFHDEERILDLSERLMHEEQRMSERQSAVNDRAAALDRRLAELSSRITTLKDARIKTRERNRLTILNLPVEVQISILQHLPWQYHLYCFQVFPMWREIPVLADSQPQRYHVSEHNYCPRMHKLGADSGWELVVQDGRLESATYVVDLNKGVEGAPPSPDRRNSYMMMMGMGRRKSAEAISTTVDLMKSAILEDPLFWEQPAYPDKEITEIDSLSFQIGACDNGYEALFMQQDEEQKDVSFNFPFEEHPELRDMQIIEFLDWVAAWVSRVDVLKKYRRITMGLSFRDLVGRGFTMLFHDLS